MGIRNALWIVIVSGFAMLPCVAAAQQATPDKPRVPRMTNDDVTAPAEPTAPSLTGDPHANIIAAWEALKTYRVQMILKTPKGAVAEQMDVVAPDRLHMIAKSLGTESIIIGSTAYARRLNGAWQRDGSPGGANLARELLGDLGPKAYLKGASELTPTGTERMDGVLTQIYEFRDTSPGAQGQKGRLWVGMEDWLPRRVQGEMANGATVDARFYDFGQPITVGPPM
ncbi:MAG TPA: hypothetical protein VJX67_19435 [Blastocatellia bacterium]|nr:hypothetical protein [Blastocatellia bacterium]